MTGTAGKFTDELAAEGLLVDASLACDDKATRRKRASTSSAFST
jgi:hypothetical protein